MDMVEQATQFEYTHNVEISSKLMDLSEHYLFWYSFDCMLGLLWTTSLSF